MRLSTARPGTRPPIFLPAVAVAAVAAASPGGDIGAPVRLRVGAQDERRRRGAGRTTSWRASVSVSTQVSLEPPPWLELTTKLPAGSATRVRPPGTTQTSSPVLTANGRRSMWRGAIPSGHWVGLVDSCTTSWAIQPRGLAGDDRPHGRQHLVAGLGPDDQALAARAVDRLQHQLVEPPEHLGQHVGVLQAVGGNVGEDCLLAQVVPDQVGHVRVDRLVVGQAVADRVGDGHVARPGRVEQAWAAEHRFRAGSAAGRGSRRRCGGRARRCGVRPRWCACTARCPCTPGPGPRPARCPSGGPGTSARSRPSCRPLGSTGPRRGRRCRAGPTARRADSSMAG